MSRAGRVFFEGAVYHVYNRLARGEQAFGEESEAQWFRKLLQEVAERDGLTVFAWCLMSNHYHLAVRTGQVSLDRPMRSLQQRVTRRVNARRKVFGPLWQGRYRAKLVEDQRYLDRNVPVTPFRHCGRVGRGRWPMSRAGRVFFEGAVYHVYNRLARGEQAFGEESEAQWFRKLLQEVAERDGLTVFAWCSDEQSLPHSGANRAGFAGPADAEPPAARHPARECTSEGVRPVVAGALPGEAGRGPALPRPARDLHPPEPGHRGVGE